MAIRFPLQTVLKSDNSTEVGAGSVNGGVSIPFTLPQDCDGVVVKFTASVAGAGISAVLQTTDDGGSTWYDVARTSVVSNANAVTAEWITAQTTSNSGAIGRAGASTLTGSGESGLPVLSQTGRVFIILGGNITAAASNSIITKIMVNSQSATA